jgi:hypothetical protein
MKSLSVSIVAGSSEYGPMWSTWVAGSLIEHLDPDVRDSGQALPAGLHLRSMHQLLVDRLGQTDHPRPAEPLSYPSIERCARSGRTS